jgi:hypothetical protein
MESHGIVPSVDEDNFLVVETAGKEVFYHDEVKAEAEVHFEGVSPDSKDAFFSVTVRANTTPPEDLLKTITLDLSASVFWDINQDYSTLSHHPSKSELPPVIDAVFDGLIQHINTMSQEKNRNYHLNVVLFSDKPWVYPDRQIPISGEQNKATREKLIAELREIQRLAKLKYQATELDYYHEPVRPIQKTFLNLTPEITKLEQEVKKIPEKYQSVVSIVAGGTNPLAAHEAAHELCDPKFLCEILQITHGSMSPSMRPLKKRVTKKDFGMPPDTKYENVADELDLEGVAKDMSVMHEKTMARAKHLPGMNTLLLREYVEADIEKNKMLSYQGPYPGTVRVMKSDQFSKDKIASELKQFPETVVTGQFQFSLQEFSQFNFCETNQTVRTVVAIPVDKVNDKSMKSRLTRDGVETGTGVHDFVMDKTKKASVAVMKERADAWFKTELSKKGLHPNDELRLNQALQIYIFKNHLDKLHPIDPNSLRQFILLEKKNKPVHLQVLFDNLYDTALNGDFISVLNAQEIYNRLKREVEKVDCFGQILQAAKSAKISYAQNFVDELIEQQKLQMSLKGGMYSAVVQKNFTSERVVTLSAPVGLKKRR